MAKSSSAKKAGPLHEIRLGRIRAAIWENETQNATRHNVTVSRFYKDGEEWKDSSSFGRDDSPLVAKVLDRCHSWIFEQAAGASGSDHGNSEDGHF